jgi:hypothetical protein
LTHFNVLQTYAYVRQNIARLASGLFDQPPKNILLAEKDHLLRCAAMTSLDVRKEYACALSILVRLAFGTFWAACFQTH